jgi:putative ABC transport system substrate-binding protein
MLDLRRREIITLLGGAVAAWPFAARGQQMAMPIIGFLSIASPEAWTDYILALKHGLGQAGFIEGQNVARSGKQSQADRRSFRR